MSAVPVARIPTAWRLALPLTLAALAWLLIWYRDTALAMADTWARSETFTHGFVVPPIVAWLVWHRREHLAARVPRPDLRWLLPIALGAFAWFLGDLTATNALAQLALVSMIVFSVPLLLGVDTARVLWFPLVFLYFAVPIGEFIVPQLMEWTADFTVMAIRASGIPVFREGMHFVIPSGRWSVIEACSGIRYLIASVTVGTLFAYLNYHSLRRRLMFVGVSIIVPIVANWLRAYMIVMLGHLSGNTIAVGVDHLIYGWIFFGVVILLMFLIGARWAEPELPPPARLPEIAVANQRAFECWRAAVLLAVLVVLPQGALQAVRAEFNESVPNLDTTVLAKSGWNAVQAPRPAWRPDFANASQEVNVAFARGPLTVGVYVGYYRNQNFQRKLLTSANEIVATSNKAWIQTGNGELEASWSGRALPVTRTRIKATDRPGESEHDELTVWHVLWTDGQFVRRPEIAKFLLAKSILSGRGDDSAVVMLYAFGDDATATEALSQFAADHGDALAALLQTARE